MSNSKIYTIAFYNIENLFDVEDDPFTDDNDFLPYSKKRWTTKRYKNKLRKLGSVIAKIGSETAEEPPTLIGLAEVENKRVLNDLLQSEHLLNLDYNYVHYNSSDERGIDVALLYNSKCFEVLHSETFAVYLKNELGERDYTRDILWVKGLLQNETVHVIVNHWSSRREGATETEHKRLAAAKVVNSIITTIKQEEAEAKIIVMGDFNDNPNNKSMQYIEEESGLYNPFKTLWSKDNGSLNHKFEWNLFDQILISTNFFNSETSELSFNKAAIFNHKFLTQYHGKYKGQPFRTYVGKKYKGGYSDHFPVYIELKTDNR